LSFVADGRKVYGEVGPGGGGRLPTLTIFNQLGKISLIAR
jgi:hypothetical protein